MITPLFLKTCQKKYPWWTVELMPMSPDPMAMTSEHDPLGLSLYLRTESSTSWVWAKRLPGRPGEWAIRSRNGEIGRETLAKMRQLLRDVDAELKDEGITEYYDKPYRKS